MIDVLTIGEALVVFETPGIRGNWEASACVGGPETNVAIDLCRLGHTSRWVGRVSDDSLGSWVENTLESEGVDTRFVRRDWRSAGIVVLEHPVRDYGLVSFLRKGSAGSMLAPNDVLPALDGCRRVHFSGTTLGLSPTARKASLQLARTASERGIPVSFHVTYWTRQWSRSTAGAAYDELMPYVDVVFVAEEELNLLGSGNERVVAGVLLAKGASQVVVSHGSQGATAYADGATVHIPVRAPESYNEIAAGSALCAGYLSGLLEERSPEDSLQRGIDLVDARRVSPGATSLCPVNQRFDRAEVR